MENKVLDQMLNRYSVRAFLDKAIEPEVLDQITAAAQQAPNSINGQQISLIVIQDKERLSKLADLCGGQPQIRTAAAFILVLADYNRAKTAIEMEGKEYGFGNSIEALVTGAVDAGITVQALETAAGSFGVRSTVIGALRGNLQGVIDLCNIPTNAIPLVGLTMGYPDETKLSTVKPRINKAAYAYAEAYPENIDFEPALREYADTYKEFTDKAGFNETYAGKVAALYSTDNPGRDTKSVYKKQGFEV